MGVRNEDVDECINECLISFVYIFFGWMNNNKRYK
jgi:hypothetical protein